MGSKKSSSSPTPVGQAVFATFALGVASKIDNFLELWIGDNKISDFGEESDVSLINTGVKSKQYPSNSGLSKINHFFGDNILYNTYMYFKTGIKLKYKKVAYLFFEDAFIGDNVNSVPNYSIKVRRTNIMGWSKDGILLDEINGEANPAVALYYILNKMGKIPEELINRNDFVKAALTLKEENFGISFSITDADEAKKWIEEILRHIDGALFFDTMVGQYSIKLIRDDYEVNNLISIDETNSDKIEFKKPTWSSLATSVTLQYTSAENFKTTSINKTNQTTKILSNNEKHQVVKLLAITNPEVAKKSLNSQLKKYTYPLSSVSMMIPRNLHFKPLDVIKFSNKTLGIENMILRIMEIGGDEFNKNYYEVKCIEDIFNAGDFNLTDVQQPLDILVDYNINYDAPLISNIIFLNNDMITEDIPEIIFVDNAGDTSNVTFDTITSDDGKIYRQEVEKFTELKQDLLFEKKYENSFVGYNFIEDSILLNRKEWMKEREISEIEYQQGVFSASINGELISYKSITFVDETTVSINKCIRNINNINMKSHNTNDTIFFLSNNSSTIKFTNYEEGGELQFDSTLNNKFNSSNIFNNKTEDYNDFYIKPYKVENVKWDKLTGEISFSPTYFKKENSASYQDPDSITFNSENENKVEENQIFYIKAEYKILLTDLEYTIYENYSQDLSVLTTILGSYEDIKSFNIYNIINNKLSEATDILNLVD